MLPSHRVIWMTFSLAAPSRVIYGLSGTENVSLLKAFTVRNSERALFRTRFALDLHADCLLVTMSVVFTDLPSNLLANVALTYLRSPTEPRLLPLKVCEDPTFENTTSSSANILSRTRPLRFVVRLLYSKAHALIYMNLICLITL